jgi:2-methylcitrate dehydratase PrpD
MSATVAERLADRIGGLNPTKFPRAVQEKCEDLLIDVVGLCVAARNTDYAQAALAACSDDGPCTAIGFDRRLTATGAALINGTTAHGEDFDDTFEGGPIHAGSVILPSVLAAAERYGADGRAALLGVAVGVESICRLSLVAPKAIHDAGFHPTAVLGAMAAAAAVSATLRLTARQTVNALGIAGSMASGIIEYLAEGAWTKRMHPGWAAQSGLHAAELARAGFNGPRTVFEGTHGLFHGFAHTTEGNYGALVDDFGERWLLETLAFKPYPCGTMAHPFIDCARRLAARGIAANEIRELVCETAEGIVHRLWEPLANKQRPGNGYAAKFSIPYCVAAAFMRDGIGLDTFTDESVRDPQVIALASRVRYEIDPNNRYPDAFTGHIRAVLRDGTTFEERQPYFRGGAHEPLSRRDIEEKFKLNARHGGWSAEQSEAVLGLARRLFNGPIDLGIWGR